MKYFDEIIYKNAISRNPIFEVNTRANSNSIGEGKWQPL